MKITSLQDLPELPVSHNPSISKQRLVGAGEISRVTGFSRAIFPPGEIAFGHSHKDMTEVFYIESGAAEIEIDGRVFALPEGSCVTVEPGEIHELRNMSDARCVVLYFGIES